MNITILYTRLYGAHARQVLLKEKNIARNERAMSWTHEAKCPPLPLHSSHKWNTRARTCARAKISKLDTKWESHQFVLSRFSQRVVVVLVKLRSLFFILFWLNLVGRRITIFKTDTHPVQRNCKNSFIIRANISLCTFHTKKYPLESQSDSCKSHL